jgi:hypothetical protein
MFPRKWFMVTNQLWEKHGVGKKMLCMDCFEIRIGRKLTGEDLLDCFVNNNVNIRTIELLKKQELRIK